MDLNAATVSALVRLTLTRPREAAARLLALNVPDDARWLGLSLSSSCRSSLVKALWC